VACTTAIHAVLSLVLLHWIGFYGPALSAILTSYLLSSFYFFYARRLTGGTVASLLPLATFARVLAVGAVRSRAVQARHRRALAQPRRTGGRRRDVYRDLRPWLRGRGRVHQLGSRARAPVARTAGPGVRRTAG
jgi:hypothetical protein